MTGIVANAGLFDVAFGQAMVALAMVAAGTIFGGLGLICAWLRCYGFRLYAILFGILALAGAFGNVGHFWAVNGDRAWEHACEYPLANSVLFGLPFLTGVGAILMGSFRREGGASTGEADTPGGGAG